MGIFDRKSLLNPKPKANKGAPPAEAVDLREGAEASGTKFGQPTRCPECSGRGYLDRIDLVHRVMFQHCLECNHKWELTESELARPV